MDKKKLLGLVAAALQNDRKAQARLINDYWVDVFSFIMKKVQDEVVADELTVQVFSKVLGKLDLYDPNFQFKTWVLTIAQNAVIDYWRKLGRDNEQATANLEEVKNIFARSPEELLISEEEELEIQQVIASLDTHYQDIIRLRFFEEKSMKEIAQELNISVSNAKVRIMRAKRVLAKLLKNNNLLNE